MTSIYTDVAYHFVRFARDDNLMHVRRVASARTTLPSARRFTRRTYVPRRYLHHQYASTCQYQYPGTCQHQYPSNVAQRLLPIIKQWLRRAVTWRDVTCDVLTCYPTPQLASDASAKSNKHLSSHVRSPRSLARRCK